MDKTIEDIWINHRNELIAFLEEKGQSIYDEEILQSSISDEKLSLLEKASEWLLDNTMSELNLDHGNVHLVRQFIDNFKEAMKDQL